MTINSPYLEGDVAVFLNISYYFLCVQQHLETPFSKTFKNANSLSVRLEYDKGQGGQNAADGFYTAEMLHYS